MEKKLARKSRSRDGEKRGGDVRTLAIDIGGTGIKVVLLDESGQPVSERERVETPKPATPDAVIAAIEDLATRVGPADRVSAGFPGVVRKGVTETAPNLHPSWDGYDLAAALATRLNRPARVANDADVQGYAVVSGAGVELVLTLGTGLGSALFYEGHLVPNLEVAHHRFRASGTYEEYLGKKALEKAGRKKWNRRLARAIDELRGLFNFDRLFLGGGNAKKVEIELPGDVQLVSNFAGLLGGIALWRDGEVVASAGAV